MDDRDKLCVMFCVLSAEEPQFTNSYDQGRFLLRWIFNDQEDTITFHIRVQTTGWVGFGFADIAPNSMQGYDVIVGGFENGRGSLNVSFINRRTSLPWNTEVLGLNEVNSKLI